MSGHRRWAFSAPTLRLAVSPGTDEDIATLDMHELASSPSYKSTPTRSSRSSRIQPTPVHGFGDISLIRSQNEVILDALES